MARRPTPSQPKAAAASAPAILPKPAQLVPGVVTVDLSTNRGANIPLSNTYTSYVNKAISAVRGLGDPQQMVRALRRISGDVATALAMKVRLANTPLTWSAFSSDHQLNPDGANILRNILRDFDFSADYTSGYDNRQSVQGVVETMLNEVGMSGGIGLELVLDKLRLPYKLKPVSPTQLKWKVGELATGGLTHKMIPWQQLQGATIELDIHTFFFSALDYDPTFAYPFSPMEVAINTLIFKAEVVEDVRRVVRRSGHSRLMVVIDEAKARASAPVSVQVDPVKLQEYLEATRAAAQAVLEQLNPESALVVFDSMAANYLNSEIGASADYTPLMETVDGLAAVSLGTPKTVLGMRGGGSQNVSSVESLLFLKSAASLQPPVETVLSRALTLALRLTGFDGYVVAKFSPVDLRPENELEAFRSMKLANELQLLSYGFRTDDEFAMVMGTGARAVGAPPLSGTMFYTNSVKTDPTTADTNQDPGRQALTGNTPKKAGGKSQ